jgi:hypothetical protein
VACWALEHGYTYEWTIPCLTGHDKIAKDMIEMNDTVVKAKAGKKNKNSSGLSTFVCDWRRGGSTGGDTDR